MFVLEAPGELDEVFAGSRNGQEGSMSTTCCTRQRFPAPQEAMTSPTPAPGRFQGCSGNAPAMVWGMLPEASRASLEFNA